MTDELAIEARGLEKSYGTARVLARVDLRVTRGTVFSLLGPNGAGKTTMVRILSTLTRPDAGQARVAGFDIVGERHLVRRSISLTGQYATVDLLQTGEENLRMMGRLSGTCSSGLTWPTWRGGGSPPTRAACAAGWTWGPAWSAALR